MEAIFYYLGKVIICSGVMFLYYQLSLKDKTFHHYNRFYLLSAMLISVLLPLIKVEDFTIEVSNKFYLLLDSIQNFNNHKNIQNDNIYSRIIFSALGLVSIYFLGKLIYGIFRIQQLKGQFKKESFEGVNFYQTNLSEAPFSYFRNLFWKDSIIVNSDVGRQILKHEMVHIEQKHSFDKIFIEIFTAVFWFNPFFHFIKKEISLIHEYLADKKAVKQSDTKAFAQMLLASHFSGTPLPATSPFLSSNLKKRLKMLQTPQTKFGYARRIFALPVIFTVAFAYLVNAKNQEIEKTNIEIEKAVSEIKKDTLSPKNQAEQIVKLQQEKISKASEKLKIQSEKLKTLSEKSKEKAVELQKIAKEKGEKSYEFELKAKELKQLSSEMDKIVDREKVFRDVELSKALANGEHYTFRLNEDRAKGLETRSDEGYRSLRKQLDSSLDRIFESEEFKEKSGLTEQKIKALKDAFSSADFKDEFKKIDRVYLNTKNVYGKDSSFKVSGLSKKDQKKLQKLAKEKAELAEKQAEIARKQAEIVRIKAQNSPWIVAVDAHAPKSYSSVSTYTEAPMPPNSKILSSGTVFKTNVKDMLTDNHGDEIKIFIDGKASSNEEMKDLDPKNIASINITKTKMKGDEAGEIHITTKSAK